MRQKQKPSGRSSSRKHSIHSHLTYSHSTILNLDVNIFLKHFRKWGPSARTCIGLARGTLPETELQLNATSAARTFAKDPSAVTMEAPTPDSSHVLFTVTPDDDSRTASTLRVATSYLSGLVMGEIAKIDVADQVTFYHRASSVPQFKGTLGYIFEKYFLVWLYSAEQADVLHCTAKSSRFKTSAESSKSKRPKRNVELSSLQPLGRKKLTVINGDSNFANAKDSNTPFGWLPASRVFPSFDVVMCTDDFIITIQLTVSSTHSMKPAGFIRLKENLPARFEKARTWCHVFVTDSVEKATSLRRQRYKFAKKEGISIYSAVFDVSKCKFSSDDVQRTLKTLRVCRRQPPYISLGTYLGVIRPSLLRWTPVGWK